MKEGKPVNRPHSYILVVEDNPDSRETLTLILEGVGYEVKSAENGREALTTLKNHPHPCIILLDLMMPVMDGWEFRQHQQNDPNLAQIPTVVVSAISDPERLEGVGAVE